MKLCQRLLGSRQRRSAYGPKPAAMFGEVLSSRQMLSGNVIATMVDGTLQISGDTKDNSIEISVHEYTSPTQESGVYRVEAFVAVIGLENTTINNNTSGLDRVEFAIGTREIDKTTLPSQTPEYSITSLDIDLGRGNDTANINLHYIESSLVFPPEDSLTPRTSPPRVPLSHVQIDGNSHVALGAGDDSLQVWGGQFDRRLTVNGQSGDDEIGINSAMRNVTVLGSRGDDRMSVSGTVDRTATIRTAGGDDVVSLSGTVHRANLSTGSGDDLVFVAGQLNYFRATTSRGHDDIALLATVDRETRIDTGDGDDTLNLTPSRPFTTGGIPYESALPQYFTFSSARLSGRIRIHLGDGDDSLVAAGYVGIRHHIPFISNTEFDQAQPVTSEPALQRIGIFPATASINADNGVINGGRGVDSLTVNQDVLDDLNSVRSRRFESTLFIYGPVAR